MKPSREVRCGSLHKLDIIDKQRRVAIGLHGFTCHFPSAVNPGSWAIEKRELEGGYEVSLPPVAATLEMIPDLSPGVLFGEEAEGVTLNFESLAPSTSSFVTACSHGLRASLRGRKQRRRRWAAKALVS